MRPTASARGQTPRRCVTIRVSVQSCVYVFGVQAADNRSEHTMAHNDNDANPDEPTNEQQPNDSLVRSFTFEGKTVLYDPEIPERFIQSDTAVELTEAR